MESLVRSAVAGKAEAFEELMKATSPSIRRLLAAQVSDPHDVADLQQEVYLRALRGLGGLSTPGQFKPWLNTIARNLVRDHYRGRARRPSLPVAQHDDHAAVGDVTTEDLVELRELAGRVKTGLARLPASDAVLLSMVTVLGFTPTDIAGVLGMTPNAAKVAVHRARTRLRQFLLFEEIAPRSNRRCADFDRMIDESAILDAALHSRACETCGGKRAAMAAASVVPPDTEPAPAS